MHPSPTPMPAPELLRHLSTMATGELLQSDLTVRAKFVGANDRLPTDERAEIDTREVLSASWTQRRVRDVASRMHDGTEPVVARQSPNLGTAERWTSRSSALEAASCRPTVATVRSHFVTEAI